MQREVETQNAYRSGQGLRKLIRVSLVLGRWFHAVPQTNFIIESVHLLSKTAFCCGNRSAFTTEPREIHPPAQHSYSPTRCHSSADL